MSFGDLRGWIDHLRKQGEPQEINAEVDWDCELGTITRKAFGAGNGPARSRKTSSRATTSTCSTFRRRGGIASTAAATSTWRRPMSPWTRTAAGSIWACTAA